MKDIDEGQALGYFASISPHDEVARAFQIRPYSSYNKSLLSQASISLRSNVFSNTLRLTATLRQGAAIYNWRVAFRMARRICSLAYASQRMNSYQHQICHISVIAATIQPVSAPHMATKMSVYHLPQTNNLTHVASHDMHAFKEGRCQQKAPASAGLSKVL